MEDAERKFHAAVGVIQNLPKDGKLISYFLCHAVLEVRDILVWIWIRRPYVWLTDPNPTPFFSDFKDAKQYSIFSYFFLITDPKSHYSSVLKI